MLQTSRQALSRNVQILARHPYERDTLVDPTMKTKWGAPKKFWETMCKCGGR